MKRGRKPGFTLIELIVSIAIIGLLIALILPNLDRSLSRNNIANDAQLFTSKLEDVRLEAGSTQLIDEGEGNGGDSAKDSVGYYAVLLHATQGVGYFSVVRLSYPINAADQSCSAEQARLQAESQQGPCFVERIALSRGTTMSGIAQDYFIAYRAPTQQMAKIVQGATGWQEEAPTFTNPIFQLTFKEKVAKVKVDDYTGRVSVEYSQN